MSNELLLFKGLLSDLPSERQEKIKTMSQELKNQVAENGEDGVLAFTLAALEIQETVYSHSGE